MGESSEEAEIFELTKHDHLQTCYTTFARASYYLLVLEFITRYSTEMSAATDSSRPPDPFDGEWYSHVGGKIYGPITGHEIRILFNQKRIDEKTLFYPKNGSAWIQAKDDPILGSLFNSPAHTKSQVSKTRFGKVIGQRRATIIIGITLIAIFSWAASPYYALYDLIVGIREGDVSILENRVAWDSVRHGLRDDLNAIVLQKIKSDAKTSDSAGGSALGTGFAAILGPAIVNNLVDGYVTPQAISNLVRTNKSTESQKEEKISDAGAVKLVKQFSQLDFNRVKYAFFSGGLLTFRAEIIPDATQVSKSPITLLLRWDGNWKLTRVVLPADAINQLPNGADYKKALAPVISEKLSATTSMASTSATPKPKEPAPIEIALVNKGFKSANYRAYDYEDNITFSLSIKNITNKDIRAFDGTLTFTDLLDNNIMSSKLAVNELIGMNAELIWNGAIKYNQFMDTHQRLRNEAQDNLKIKFVTRKVLFSDGSTTEY